MRYPHIVKFAAALIAAGILQSDSAQGQLVQFNIGIDGRETLASGAYRDLPNPNAGRLTFFYAHWYHYLPGEAPSGQSDVRNSHYHGISSYSYTGPVEGPAILNTNANSRIPEIATGQPPLTLVPGTGLYEGKLINGRTEENFSDPRIHSVWLYNDPARFGPGSPEFIMFNSSGRTRTNSLEGSIVALELVARSSGLNIGSTNELHILQQPGDRLVLGPGNEINFRPVLWVEGNAAAGHYWAAFKLVDTNTENGRTPFLESGIFYLDYQVAPPPSLAIQKTVTLSIPLVTSGYVLEAAPTVDGPWTALEIPKGLAIGNERSITLETAGSMQVFRFRQE